ncbi:MAG: hypothetical protein ACRENZ_08425 [Thermodesulfobacteriota bacterium]
MKKIVISTLTLLMIASHSFAENFTIQQPKLLAKAEMESSSGSNIIRQNKSINKKFEEQSQKINEFNKERSSSKLFREPRLKDSNANSVDISLLINEELKLQKNLNLEYKAPLYSFKEIPIFISSKDEKTKGLVLPPFLFFKKRF